MPGRARAQEFFGGTAFPPSSRRVPVWHALSVLNANEFDARDQEIRLSGTRAPQHSFQALDKTANSKDTPARGLHGIHTAHSCSCARRTLLLRGIGSRRCAFIQAVEATLDIELLMENKSCPVETEQLKSRLDRSLRRLYLVNAYRS